MKPSERIKEIHKDIDNKLFTPETIAQSIMHYLDEQWEQQKPYEEVVCEKCGLSGQIDGYGLCWSSRCTNTRETL